MSDKELGEDMIMAKKIRWTLLGLMVAVIALFGVAQLTLPTDVEAAGAPVRGLFHGIDDGDGSTVLVSVTPSGNDYRILWTESNFGICNNSPLGVIDVTGPFSGGKIVATGKLICFDSGSAVDTLCFGLTGCTVADLPPFTLDYQNSKQTVHNSDGGNLIIAHRISTH